MSQRLIPAGKRSGLQTHTATTEIVHADEKLTAFLELEKAVRPSRKRGFDRARHVDVRDAFIVRA